MPVSKCVFNCNFLQILELQNNNISVNITSITATYNVNKAGVSVHIFTGKYIFHQDILAQLYFHLLFSDLKNKHTYKQKQLSNVNKIYEDKMYGHDSTKSFQRFLEKICIIFFLFTTNCIFY